MSIEKARAYLASRGMEDRVIEFTVSSATVALAAEALGCEEAHIAKTLSFDVQGRTVLVIAAGDAKVDNPKFKAKFGTKPKMLAYEDVEPRVGHAVGGVCPFGVNDGVEIYLDESLWRFETIYPAAGNAASAVRLTPDELRALCDGAERVDVCKGWA